ncbi:MAG TPA: efflux RND transporter periplasmic adaptor subunit [Oceanipulchritudo sp.]|nr:efflux RND transporter periplasmic adaptor subunit [Oceanipulchritudo sp.]
MKNLYLIFTTLAASAVLFLTGCGHKESTADQTVLPSVDVKTATVQRLSHSRAQWLPGTVHPAEQAVVAAKLMATVEQAEFTIGQLVAKGDLLVVLRAEEIDAQVEQARAALAQVERNYEREKSLLAQSATTAETVRTLEDQMRLARARLAEVVTMEGYLNIKAPFDGIITSKQVRRGDLATPGTPMLTIEGTGHQQVHVQVPDSLSALGYASSIQIEADGKVIDTSLTEWSPAADPASRTRLAKLDLPDGAKVRSGQYVRVNWPAGETSSLWMPASALSVMGQMERVFVILDGQTHLRLVRTGAREGDLVQILAGLDEGEQVVLSPSVQLRDGQPANIQS